MTQSYPPHAGYGPSQQYQPQPRNGFGITALVVGLIAICLGLIPLFGLGAIIGGIIAVVFGLLGFARARRGVATNKKISLIGTSAGVLAGALGIWGLVIVDNAFTKLDNAIKGAAPSAAAPAAPGAPAGTRGARINSITGCDGGSSVCGLLLQMCAGTGRRGVIRRSRLVHRLRRCVSCLPLGDGRATALRRHRVPAPPDDRCHG